MVTKYTCILNFRQKVPKIPLPCEYWKRAIIDLIGLEKKEETEKLKTIGGLREAQIIL